MTKIINTTCKAIKYQMEKGEAKGKILTFKPDCRDKEPKIVRKPKEVELEVETSENESITLTTLVTKTEEQELINIPEKKEGVLYIVNKIIFHGCKDRNDFLLPTGVKKVQINGKSQLVCTRFTRRL